MLLKVGIAHLTSLRLSVLFVLARLGLALKDNPWRTSPTMEADVPSHLDIPDCGTRISSRSQQPPELNNPLVISVHSFQGGVAKLIPRILQVFRVGIVQGSNLTLCVAVFLQGIRVVVLLGGVQRHCRHIRGKASGYVGSRECSPRVKRHLSLHPNDLVPGV